MRLVLRQSFPLGRFHATPWRASPFDDAHGEWPPSPWRLVRAVAARWHQWHREVGGDVTGSTLEPLSCALCTSSYAFDLPRNTRRGLALRFYQPGGWKTAGTAGTAGYTSSLAKDNYWAVPPSAELRWLVAGPDWTDQLCDVLDRCLERVTYFGRGESLTEICRLDDTPSLRSNVVLYDDAPSSEAVPVLVPEPTATIQDVQRATGDNRSREQSVPPGARWRYAVRPPRPITGERRSSGKPRGRPVHLVQIAVGVAVAPEPRAVCHLTGRFREQLLTIAATERTATLGAPISSVSRSGAPVPVRAQLALLAGKDADGRPLKGHRHLRLAVWFKGRRPVRLLAWRRPEPFADWELDALHAAAERHLSWQLQGGSGAPAWTVRLIALDPTTPPPAGFGGERADVWESVTPYVPTRHRFRKDGSVRSAENLRSQVARELAQLEFDVKGLVVDVRGERWAAVHLPPARDAQRSIGDKRGFLLRLEFSQAVAGPIAIGHSSHYGLGLFRPAT